MGPSGASAGVSDGDIPAVGLGATAWAPISRWRLRKALE